VRPQVERQVTGRGLPDGLLRDKTSRQSKKHGEATRKTAHDKTFLTKSGFAANDILSSVISFASAE
jgi:hypothetical protein